MLKIVMREILRRDLTSFNLILSPGLSLLTDAHFGRGKTTCCVFDVQMGTKKRTEKYVDILCREKVLTLEIKTFPLLP